jgi:diguanylate cyclase (GGDEF)-like protein
MTQLNVLKIAKVFTLILVFSSPIHALCKSQNLTSTNSYHSKLSLDLTREEKAWLAEHKEITVGVKHSWKPLEFLSEKKKFRGFTMDYLHALEPELGVRFKMFNIDENSKKEADILSSVANPNIVDSKKYLLTDPILKFSHAIYVHKDNKNINKIEDLNEKRVAIFRRGQLANLLSKDFSYINLINTDVIEEAFNEIENGNSDAYIGNEMVVDYEANLKGISYLKKIGYVPIETELTMAVRSDWPILQSILNKSFIALEPRKNEFLSHWDMSLFKKTSKLVYLMAIVFVLLVGVTLFRAYVLKQKLKAAHYDLLTNLPNRTMFNEDLELETKYARRNNKLFGLIYIDLDLFKEVNDQHGHTVGDLLLMQVGKRLQHCVRSTDKVYRLGGDEFTIILTDLDDHTFIEKTAMRVVKTLSDTFEINQLKINITSSIGSTAFPYDAIDAASMIKNSDMAMYEAKKHGKNCFQPFVQSMQDLATHKLNISNELKSAIENDEFVLYYQPIFDLKTIKTVKAEALIRWQHPKNGITSPGAFIEIAEETNAITEIGDWVFKQALEDIIKFKKAIDSNFSISLNVSPKQFGNNSLLNHWPKLLRELKISSNSIGIEITEGLLLDVNKSTTKILNDLREAGAQFLLDDFGTGYSSLLYLKKLDVDYIKIDKSFIQNLSSDFEDIVLCEAIIVMAHKLGMEVIAEGIETKQQQDLLIKIGCDYGQGYLFSKPKTIEQFLIDHQSGLSKHKISSHATSEAYAFIYR